MDIGTVKYSFSDKFKNCDGKSSWKILRGNKGAEQTFVFPFLETFMSGYTVEVLWGLQV